MSSCLYVYQDHVGMGSWGSSSEIYQASTAPYNPADEYGEAFDPFKGFSRIIDHLQDKIEEHKEQLRVLDRVMNGQMAYDDRYDAATQYEEISQDIQRLKDQIVVMRFLLSVAEDGQYVESAAIWTWGKM